MATITKRLTYIGYWLFGLNAFVFVVLRLGVIIDRFADTNVSNFLFSNLMFPSTITGWLGHPWTIFTYMFTQYDVWHLIMNLMWLYFFGRIFTIISSPNRLFILYLIGGIIGALAFLCIPADTKLLTGASASVLAIVSAPMIIAPNYKLNLAFFGPARLIWVSTAALILIIIASGTNYGMLMAHCGGIIAGLACGLWWKYSYSLGPKNSIGTQPNTLSDKEELNIILDKVRRSGYTSLNADERDRLFKISNRIKS